MALKIGDKFHSVKIWLDSYRMFDNAGINFKFPSNMHFSTDGTNKNVKMWNIDGDNTSIMIQEFMVPATEKSLLAALKNQYIKMGATVKESTTQLKGKQATLDGKKLSIRMGNVDLAQQVYFIKNGKYLSVMILQDSLDGDKNTPEFLKMLELIRESLTLRK